MKRSLASAFVGAIVLTTLLVAPAAQGASTGIGSTSCSMSIFMKFKPALVHGLNPRAFIKLSPRLGSCTGGAVSYASGYGGAIGDLRCDSGQVFRKATAKAMLFWDTGDTSGLNFWIEFSRSRLHGVVTDGLFKGEHFETTFSWTALRGDCADSPLIRGAATNGTLEF